MNGESAFGWIKAGAVLLVAAVVIYILWKGYATFANLFSGVTTWWNNQKTALAEKKAIWDEKESTPPLAPGTIVSNAGGAATGIVLPMRRRATGTSIDANAAQYSPNPSPFTDPNTNYL